MAKKAAKKIAATLSAKNKKAKTRGRPAFGVRHGFLEMGVARNAAEDWTVVLGTDPVYFTIDEAIIARAEPGNARRCVVALALEKVFGKGYDYQVGKSHTKIWDRDAKIELRLRTPRALSKQIDEFDDKKGWQLPPNIYKLLPMTKSDINGYNSQASREAYHRNKKKKPKRTAASTRKKPINKPGPKPRRPGARLILRNARIAWVPPVL